MPRLSIEHLPIPPDPHRIDQLMADFETVEAAAAEDRYRAGHLMTGGGAWRRLLPKSQIADLRSRLSCETVDNEPPQTIASARMMRTYRINVTGALLQLAVEASSAPLVVVTGLPRTWDFEPSALPDVSAGRLMASLCSDLNRCGATEAGGWFFAALHGEFEPTERQFRLHWHAAAAGDMVKVVECLGARRNYRSTRPPVGSQPSAVRQRLRITRSIDDYPRALSYILKSFWPERRIGPVGESGEIRRERRIRRLSQPHHTQSLLWLDQQSLGNLCLMVNIRVSMSGFTQNTKMRVL